MSAALQRLIWAARARPFLGWDERFARVQTLEDFHAVCDEARALFSGGWPTPLFALMYAARVRLGNAAPGTLAFFARGLQMADREGWSGTIGHARLRAVWPAGTVHLFLSIPGGGEPRLEAQVQAKSGMPNVSFAFTHGLLYSTLFYEDAYGPVLDAFFTRLDRLLQLLPDPNGVEPGP